MQHREVWVCSGYKYFILEFMCYPIFKKPKFLFFKNRNYSFIYFGINLPASGLRCGPRHLCCIMHNISLRHMNFLVAVLRYSSCHIQV